MFRKDEFMNYMGYRNTIVENKIDKHVTEIRGGSMSGVIDCEDLTDEEVEYLLSEIASRI